MSCCVATMATNVKKDVEQPYSVVFRLVGSNPEELAQTHTRRKSGVFFYGPAIIYGHVRKPKNFSHERKERKTERTFRPHYIDWGWKGGNSRRLHIYGLELRHVCGRFYYDVMSSHEYFRRYKSHTQLDSKCRFSI
jgi:hypothetical protein